MTDLNKAIERLENELIPAVSIDEADDIRTLIAAVQQGQNQTEEIAVSITDLYRQLGGEVK